MSNSVKDNKKDIDEKKDTLEAFEGLDKDFKVKVAYVGESSYKVSLSYKDKKMEPFIMSTKGKQAKIALYMNAIKKDENGILPFISFMLGENYLPFLEFFEGTDEDNEDVNPDIQPVLVFLKVIFDMGEATPKK